MNRPILAAALLCLMACGPGLAPSFDDYQVPGATRVRGELRTSEDTVPRRGRITLRTEAGETLASAAADETGRFSFEVEPAGTVKWIAVDDDGHAARGSWALQPHGDNALGRLWLSAAPAAPWLVAERGLGFEERLTQFSDGLSPGLEISGDRVWAVGQNGLSGLRLSDGEVARAAEELPWSSYWKGLVSLGRYLPGGSDRRADVPSCATLFVQVDVRTLVVWDPAQRLELERFDFPNTTALVDVSTREGLVFLGCDAVRATLMRYVKTANDERELSVERYDQSGARHLASLALLPGERVIDRTAEVVLLSRVDGVIREFRLWWPDENRLQPLSPLNFIWVGLDRTGRTLWGGTGANTTLIDAASGERTELGETGSFRSSSNREWLLAFRRKGELRQVAPNLEQYFTTGLELTRVELATRAVSRPPPLPEQVATALAKGIGNFDGLSATIFDDGSVVVLVQTGEGSWLCDLNTGAVSAFTPEPPRSDQSFEVVRAGEQLVVIERLLEASTTDWSESAVFHVGRPGVPLRRRTFLSSTTGAVRVGGGALFFARRDPLTGTMQLSRLALDSP